MPDIGSADVNLSGLYKIINLINGKFYIGSAVHFRKRWELHRSNLKNNKHDNRHLQNAWNLHGDEAFKFEILKFCDKKDLLNNEQIYINWLNPEYNICKIVANSRLGVKSSPEHVAKIIAANKGKAKSEECKAKLRIARLGVILTEAQKQAKRDYRHGEEAKKKIGERSTLFHATNRQKFFDNITHVIEIKS